jgi:hypothetical protein
VEDQPTQITTRTAALEALDSYDPAETKRGLRFLVDEGDFQALSRILPLTQHPDPAIRFVAKRAAKELRSLPPEARRTPAPSPSKTQFSSSQEDLEILPQVVNGPGAQSLQGIDPRLKSLLEAPLRRRPRPPRSGGVPMRWFNLEL